MLNCEMFIWNQPNPSINLLIESHDHEAMMEQIEFMIFNMIDSTSCFAEMSSDLAALAVACLQLATNKVATFDTICTNLIVFEWSSQQVLTCLYIMVQVSNLFEELDWLDYEAKVIHSLATTMQSFTKLDFKSCLYMIIKITIQRKNALFLHKVISHISSSTLSKNLTVVVEVLSSFFLTSNLLSLCYDNTLYTTTITSQAVNNQLLLLAAFSMSISENIISSIAAVKSHFGIMLKALKRLILSNAETANISQPNIIIGLVDIIICYHLLAGGSICTPHNDDVDSVLAAITTIILTTNNDVGAMNTISEHLITRLISYNAGFLIDDSSMLENNNDSLDRLVIIQILLAIPSLSSSLSATKPCVTTTRAIALWMTTLTSEAVCSLVAVHSKVMDKLLSIEAVFISFVDILQRYNLWSTAFNSSVVLSHVLRSLSAFSVSSPALLEYHLIALINSSDIEERVTFLHSLISYFQRKKESVDISSSVRGLLRTAILRKYQQTENSAQIIFSHLILNSGNSEVENLVFLDDFEAVAYLVGLLYPNMLTRQLSSFISSNALITAPHEGSEEEGGELLLSSFYVSVFSLLLSPPLQGTTTTNKKQRKIKDNSCCLLLPFVLLSGLQKACCHLAVPTANNVTAIINTLHNLMYGITQLYTHTTATASFTSSSNSCWMRMRPLYEDTLSRSINQSLSSEQQEQFRIIRCDNAIDYKTIVTVLNQHLDMLQLALQSIEPFLSINSCRWTRFAAAESTEALYNVTWWEMNLISLTAILFELSQSIHLSKLQLSVSEVTSLYRGYQSMATLASLKELTATINFLRDLQRQVNTARSSSKASRDDECLFLLQEALVDVGSSKKSDTLPRQYQEKEDFQPFNPIRNNRFRSSQLARTMATKLQPHLGQSCCTSVLQHFTRETLESMVDIDKHEKQKILADAMMVTEQTMLWHLQSEWMELLEVAVKSMLQPAKELLDQQPIQGINNDRDNSDMLVNNMLTMFVEELWLAALQGASIALFESNADLLYTLSRHHHVKKPQPPPQDRAREVAMVLLVMKKLGSQAGQNLLRSFLNLAIELSGSWEAGLRLQLFLLNSCCNRGKELGNKGSDCNKHLKSSDDSDSDGDDSNRDEDTDNNQYFGYDSAAESIATWLREEDGDCAPSQALLLQFDDKTAELVFQEVIRLLAFDLNQISEVSTATIPRQLLKCEYFANSILPVILDVSQRSSWTRRKFNIKPQSGVYSLIAKFLQLLTHDVKRVFLAVNKQRKVLPLVGFMMGPESEERVAYHRLPFLWSLIDSAELMILLVQWKRFIEGKLLIAVAATSPCTLGKSENPGKLLLSRQNEQLSKLTSFEQELRSMLQHFSNPEYSHLLQLHEFLELRTRCTQLVNDLCNGEGDLSSIVSKKTKKRSKNNCKQANSPAKRIKVSLEKGIGILSNNPVIARWGEDEVGDDNYADLEDFLED